MTAHCIVSSWLDCANALLHSTSVCNFHKLQNSQTRVEGGMLGAVLHQCHRVMSAVGLLYRSAADLQAGSHHIQSYVIHRLLVTFHLGLPTLANCSCLTNYYCLYCRWH